MVASRTIASSEFALDERLENDTLLIDTWPLCELRMMNEGRYPWFILIPRISGLKELFELNPEERAQFTLESDRLSKALMLAFKGDKLNVAALGNVVSQLHIHHIVRFETDPAWPAPVWGKFPVEPMNVEQIDARRSLLLRELGPLNF